MIGSVPVLRHLLTHLHTLLLVFSVAVASCADEKPVAPQPDPDPEPDPMPPTALFSTNDVASEGDTIFVTNESTLATSHQWRLTPGDVVSFNETPSFVLLDEGEYRLRLIATNVDGSDTTESAVTIAADTTFRMFGYGSKTWYLHDLSVGGTSEGEPPCYADNTLTLDLADSSYSYAENEIVCSPPGFIFEQSGSFVYTPYTAITLRAKKPFASNQAYAINELSRTRLVISYTLSSQEKVEASFGHRHRDN